MRESTPGRGNNMCRGREPENTGTFWEHSVTGVSVNKIQKKSGGVCAVGWTVARGKTRAAGSTQVCGKT